MRDHTLDEAIVEAARFIKAAKKLRAERRAHAKLYPESYDYPPMRLRAEVERAALDCRYKLADLRAGR